jgi:hypothetical protein
MTSQNSPTVQEHLKKQRVRVGMDFAVTFNQKPYFNAGIFFDEIRTILLPYTDTFRGRAVLAQEIAVLLMAHCSADVSDDVIPILTEARVRLITFAPHITQVFQVCVLALFGVLKRRPRYEQPFDETNATVKVVTKDITTSRKQWRHPMSGEHFVRLDLSLSLTRGESRMGFDSTR